MYEYRYGDHVYSYNKPLEEMTKKELLHYLKLNRDRMIEDMKDENFVSYYLYDRRTNEGFMLMEEIKRRNQVNEKGKTFLKTDWRIVGAWFNTKEKYKEYSDECTGFKKWISEF